MASKKRVKVNIAVTGSIVLFLALIVLAAISLYYGRHPYRMIIEPSPNGDQVHFLFDDRKQTTEVFITESHVTKRTEIILRNPKTIIPNGTLDFIDVTLLPGRVTISYGGRNFDVMERGYYADGIL